MENLSFYTNIYTEYMNQINEKCIEQNLDNFNNQHKLDIAVILFTIFISTYKNNLNDNQINFVLSILESNPCYKSSINNKKLVKDLKKMKNNYNINTNINKVVELNGGFRKNKSKKVINKSIRRFFTKYKNFKIEQFRSAKFK